MFSFPFKVREDSTVDIRGLDAGKVKELHGAGKRWRLWHSAGHGYQSGRDWKYGAASHWVVLAEGDVLEQWFRFEFGKEWRAARAALTELVDRLNEEPDIDHTTFLRDAERQVRDWDYKQPELTPLQKLMRARDGRF